MELFNIKLSDFSQKQINTLLTVVQREIIKLQTEQLKAELEEEQDMTAIIKDLESELEDLTLWMIQLENAKLDVKQLAHSN